MIRLATAADLPAVAAIYERIHDGEEAGRFTTGWVRGVYPVPGTAREALDRGDLFVLEEEGRVVAAAVLNQLQAPEYARCVWAEDPPPEEVMVLHTLVVDPSAQGRGHARAFLAFYEDYALARGCPYLRMDTNERNTAARGLYARLGFSQAGVVPCVFHGIPRVRMVCLEKRLRAAGEVSPPDEG